MCSCDSCECMDYVCCTPRGKAVFFSLWTIVNSAIAIAFLSYAEGSAWYMYISYAVTALHVLGGILLLLGVLRHWAKCFLTGIIISSFFPYWFIYLIYLAVVQLIFTITSCRYYSTVLKKSSNNH
ncbi:uncharacterized protein LOC115760206 [Drosophila novamexicana]|uniref:uncharacterized protein LOC115760206 n=1 Tax=Drosophila novamexicana TaxID=47314 RepID=UPI0011E5C5BD|nr:uncharacterized protein LOC115760206 [Drosophila novamexicana]